MASPQPITCPACGGAGVSQHTRHSVIVKPDGSQEPTVEEYMGPCGNCHGSGRTQ